MSLREHSIVSVVIIIIVLKEKGFNRYKKGQVAFFGVRKIRICFVTKKAAFPCGKAADLYPRHMEKDVLNYGYRCLLPEGEPDDGDDNNPVNDGDVHGHNDVPRSLAAKS